ncbi:ras guanine nucleotide exchange factor domain-containing protein [Paraphysoderma sedebokerense]|nr:ras guanine nucleotide exchange factor domain-containing protein [Paraphysoderma sedebokerense]
MAATHPNAAPLLQDPPAVPMQSASHTPSDLFPTPEDTRAYNATAATASHMPKNRSFESLSETSQKRNSLCVVEDKVVDLNETDSDIAYSKSAANALNSDDSTPANTFNETASAPMLNDDSNGENYTAGNGKKGKSKGKLGNLTVKKDKILSRTRQASEDVTPAPAKRASAASLFQSAAPTGSPSISPSPSVSSQVGSPVTPTPTPTSASVATPMSPAKADALKQMWRKSASEQGNFGNTVRASIKRMRGKFGVSNPGMFDKSESFNVGVNSETSGDSDGESSFDAFSISAGVFETVTIKVFFASLGNPRDSREISFQLNAHNKRDSITVTNVIEHALAEWGIDENPDDYDLYQFDPKHPGIRILVKPGQFMDDLLRNMNEWRLKRREDRERITVTVPQSEKEARLEYDSKMTTKDAVAQLIPRFKLNQKEKYGLFCNSNTGFWMDENRALSEYEFKPEDKIELRMSTFQLYIRVTVPDLVTKFVIKAPPQFTGSEIISLILYNLRTKNLILPHNTSQYALWINEQKTWMDNTRTLADYSMGQESTNVATGQKEIPDNGMEYKLQCQYIKITIRTPGTNSDDVTLLTTESTSVQDLLNTLAVDNPNAHCHDYGIYIRAGELLKPTENIWKVLKDVISNAEFVYRPISKSLAISSSLDFPAKVDIDADHTRPIKLLLPMMCRRFGIKAEHIKKIKTENEDVITDLESSLEELNVKGKCLIMELDDAKIKNDHNNLSATWEKNKRRKIEGSDAKQVSENKTDHLDIWKEGPDHASNVVFASGGDDPDKELKIASATLNKIVEKLTMADVSDFGSYTSFVQTVLLTFHSFTTPEVLLRKLIERYHVPRMPSQTFKDFQRDRANVQSRVCNVLKIWTKSYTTAFLQEAAGSSLTVTEELLKFTEIVLPEDKQQSIAKQIRRNILKLRDGESESVQSRNLIPAPVPKLPKKAFDKPSMFIYDPEEVARQVCLYEFSLFKRIKPTELLNQAWVKDGENRAPNVWLMTQRFNNFAAWVSKSILEVKNLKKRAERMEFFIDVGGYLLEMYNFSSLMALIAGLNSAAVQRLKHTKGELSARGKKKLSELEKVMHPENSYKAYRESLRSIEGKETNSKIPYIGVHLLDLVYVEDGNPDMIGHQINFAKRRLVYDVITAILSLQEQLYNFTSVVEIQRMLSFPPVSDKLEAELYKVSLELEPRNWDGKTPLNPVKEERGGKGPGV